MSKKAGVGQAELPHPLKYPLKHPLKHPDGATGNLVRREVSRHESE